MHLLVASVVVAVAVAVHATWKEDQAASLVQAEPLDASTVDYFANMLDNERHLREVLQDVLVPRVAGTPANQRVRNAIERRMRALDWHVEINSHSEETLIGDMSFHNVMATLDPAAPRRLVLACHFDSKMTPQGFLGATDSAVPCAQLINLAYTMRRDLQDSMGSEVTLQLLFFDGEEAFVNWSATDSLYGSRNMAKVLQDTPYSFGGVTTNALGRIDVFVLLDLIGAKSTQFVSLKAKTQTLYDRLRGIESQLFVSGALSGYTPKKPIFADQKQHSSNIQDDHIPFENRGVPILHLISLPFPKVWHTMEDNASAIDFDLLKNLNKILRVFIAQYLRL